MDDKKTTAFYRFIRWLVRLFSPKYRIVGGENLPDGACVIVGNHCHMYGPIAGELYTPGRHFVWCAGEMMDRREVPEYAYRDFWSGKPRGLRWFYRLLSRLIAPLAEHIFTNAHTIGVYHDARVMGTFRQSVAELERGSRIVIFPECYDEHNNIIHAFQDRFIDLGRLYRRKTGEALAFVPMYLAPALKTIFFGEPVFYDASAPHEEERRRVCGELMDAITAIAAAQPVHTVVPYPNVSKKHYPKNLPLEEYVLEETTC